jgi:ASC-1-like (ASCH) protein
MSHHLVILRKVYLVRILRGQKKLECRLSRTRRPPFGVVSVGDTLWLKQSGGMILATAIAHRVTFIHPLTAAGFTDLQVRYADALGADSDFFADHAHSRFASIIHLSRVRHITPIKVPKPDRRAWVVLAGPLA